MKKESVILKVVGAACLAAMVVTVVGGIGILPKSIAVVAGTASIACGTFFFYGVSCHLRKLKSISMSLGSQALIIPADFRGTLLEEVTLAIRDFLGQSQDQLARVQEENQGLSLQLQLLRRRKSNVEEIINSIRDVVVVTDDRDRVILANEAAEQLFDFRFEKDNPRAIAEIILQEDLIKLIDKTRQSKTSHVRHELTFDGQEQPVRCHPSC